jgi:hypothetical protein
MTILQEDEVARKPQVRKAKEVETVVHLMMVSPLMTRPQNPQLVEPNPLYMTYYKI